MSKYGHVIKGWREIGEKRHYYYSRWEMNFARYLEWLKTSGEIKEWLYEPDVFWFDGIKRGVNNYKPDFKVEENDGSTVYYEVKGYMDSKSKTKIKRMAKYHPDITLIVIKRKEYNDIAKKVSGLISGWE